MKLLTLNFLTCAVKTCKSSPASFPLHVRDVELEEVELEYNALFVRNVLPRVEWEALGTVCGELGLQLPPQPAPAATSTNKDDDDSMDTSGKVVEEDVEAEDERLRKLHSLLLETQIVSGKLVCGNCGHEYAVREGIANFLLPAHLV